MPDFDFKRVESRLKRANEKNERARSLLLDAGQSLTIAVNAIKGKADRNPDDHVQWANARIRDASDILKSSRKDVDAAFIGLGNGRFAVQETGREIEDMLRQLDAINKESRRVGQGIGQEVAMITNHKVLQGNIADIERTMRALQRAKKAGNTGKVNDLLRESGDLLTQIQEDIYDTDKVFEENSKAIRKRIRKAIVLWEKIRIDTGEPYMKRYDHRLVASLRAMRRNMRMVGRDD